MLDASLTRRGFLRGAALAGTGLVGRDRGRLRAGRRSRLELRDLEAPAGARRRRRRPPRPSATPGMSTAPRVRHARRPSAPVGNIPPGWSEHDVAARDVVRRYVGNLAPALKGIYGDAVVRPAGRHPRRRRRLPRAVASRRRSGPGARSSSSTTSLAPLTPKLDGDVKVFELTIDEIEQQIDEKTAPSPLLGYNKQWPGPTIRVTEGDKVRAIFTNNLKETTGVHFHGVELRQLLHGRRAVRDPEADRARARRSPTSSWPSRRAR